MKIFTQNSRHIISIPNRHTHTRIHSRFYKSVIYPMAEALAGDVALQAWLAFPEGDFLASASSSPFLIIGLTIRTTSSLWPLCYSLYSLFSLSLLLFLLSAVVSIAHFFVVVVYFVTLDTVDTSLIHSCVYYISLHSAL